MSQPKLAFVCVSVCGGGGVHVRERKRERDSLKNKPTHLYIFKSEILRKLILSDDVFVSESLMPTDFLNYHLSQKNVRSKG